MFRVDNKDGATSEMQWIIRFHVVSVDEVVIEERGDFELIIQDKEHNVLLQWDGCVITGQVRIEIEDVKKFE